MHVIVCCVGGHRLDGKNVVFGRVVSGMGVVRQIEQLGTQQGTPKKAVRILDCGRVRKDQKKQQQQQQELEAQQPKYV